MDDVKKIGIILGLVVLVTIAGLIWTSSRAEYHLRQFEYLKTNFNNYRPSLSDRFRGIRDSQGKWDYHLRSLERLGVVVHTNLVFTHVPYTQASSRRIFRAACSNFPSAVMFTGVYWASNDPAYGIRPYAMEVWDFPTNIQRWVSFFHANNQ